MRRAYKYRLFTNANQERELATMLETHRRLYNSCLAERKSRYEAEKVTVKYAEQSARFKAERATNPYYARLNFSSAQATMRRLHKAFAPFFRRVKAKEAPGYPRFKARDRFGAIEFPAHGDGIRLFGNRLRVQHVGTIRVKLHRPVEGTIKTVTLKRQAETWYAIVSCDLGDVRVEPSDKPPVGIDVGIESFLTTSDGHHEPNPRYLKEALPELRRKQRSVARKRTGGANRRKARKAGAKVYARVANLRREHHHQVALKLVRRYGLVAVESLSIKNILGNGRLTRAISDVAWGNFLLTLRSKAESAGVAFVEVDPRGTSQECSDCGRVVRKTLGQRWHCCECGCSLHRDHNAARNILARGLLARTGPVGVKVGVGRLRPRSRPLQGAESSPTNLDRDPPERLCHVQ
jgi:putative transposase